MSDPTPEQRRGPRSTETKRFWIKFSLVSLIIISVANIYLLLFMIPKFEQIYKDALPGRQLPPLTEFIITARFALMIIALGWPILGTLLLRLQKPYAILWINIGIIWTFLQFGISFVALFMPMIGITGTMGGGR